MNRKQRRAIKGQDGSPGGRSRDTFGGLFQDAVNHHIAGRLAEAEKIYRHILSVEPQHADSLHMLGIMASDLGRHDIAEGLIRSAIAVESRAFTFYNSLGNALHGQNRLDEAIASYNQALIFKRDYADALNNLGSVYKALGKPDEAVAFYKRALTANPKHTDTLNNISVVLHDQKKFDEAAAYCQRALAINPKIAEVHFNLGNILKDQKKFDAALQHYSQALSLKPDYAEAHINTGTILQDRNLLEEAATHYQAALASKPDSFEANNNLGSTYNGLKNFEKAILFYERALALRPDTPKTLSNYAITLKSYGQLDKSIAYLKRALSLDPTRHKTYSDLLLIMVYAAAVTPEDYITAARGFGETIADRHWRQRPFTHNLDPNRKLRIGYVSPDFNDHAVNYFFEPLLKRHDRSKFEVYAYSETHKIDAITERLKHEFDHWRDIDTLDDDAAADLIEADEIDILIDLAGHTGRNRLMVFARKSAPVQVTWLGFVASTGMKAMDYRISDAHAEPVGMTEHLNTETLWRLPDIFCCYQPHENSPAVIDHPPFDDNGYITFGCFNNFAKVTDPVLAAWAQILVQVPNSRLLLEIEGLDGAKFRAEIEDRLGAVLPIGRVILEPRKRSNQFVLYNRIDIALDPFPCNGGTTSMDTLWMGVPLITLAGKNFLSRMGVTILINAGLQELIAPDVEAYITLAAQLALDTERLRSLRHQLRDRVAASPLMDQDRFAANIEAAYREMWQRFALASAH